MQGTIGDIWVDKKRHETAKLLTRNEQVVRSIRINGSTKKQVLSNDKTCFFIQCYCYSLRPLQPQPGSHQGRRENKTLRPVLANLSTVLAPAPSLHAFYEKPQDRQQTQPGESNRCQVHKALPGHDCRSVPTQSHS